MPLPMPLPVSIPPQTLPSQRIEYPPPPPRPTFVPEEPPKQPAKARQTKRVKRPENNDDDDPTAGPAPSSSQPTRSSNSNAARNARNAAARAERESRKHAEGVAAAAADASLGGGRGRQAAAAAAAAGESERGRSERGGSEIMPGDEGGKGGGGDRVAVGVVDGMRYHVDFSTLPTATIFDYLERNKALPPFGTQFIRNPFDPDARACDPRKLYSYPTIEEPVAPHPLMQHLPGTQPPGVLAPASSVGHTPYGLGIGIGPGVPVPREERRRHHKRERDDDDKDEEGGKIEAEGKEEEPVEGEVVQPGDAGPGMDVDEAEDAEGAPALRRSNRRPGLSTRRRSPSPTPSSSSSTSSPRYRPILPDLNLAHTVFAERATKDWCQALASGGGQTVQGPGVNPASAGQVMMGGTGGMQREGEVVADFLYAIRVKERALKIAHEPAHAMFQNMF
ncbi:hypothetical protein NCC49_000683 [Naganishia albida]|nr:hypothetical protein NCC49_000683 [Naganishia albida]